MMNQSFRFNVSVVSKENQNSTDHCAKTIGELSCRVVEGCKWCTSGGCYTQKGQESLCSMPFIWLGHIKAVDLPKGTRDAINSLKHNNAKDHKNMENDRNMRHKNKNINNGNNIDINRYKNNNNFDNMNIKNDKQYTNKLSELKKYND